MKTLILGASTNPARYAFLAAKMLLENKHEIVLVGNKNGEIFGNKILQDIDINEIIETVTLYLSPENQKDYKQKIIALKPKRVIFNPGSENPIFEDLLHKNNIATLRACTLVMLRTNQYVIG